MQATLTEGSVRKNILSLAIPMTIGIMAVVAFNFIDTLFIAKLGKTQLASISFTFPVVMLLTHITFGLGAGASSIISRSLGQKDIERVKQLTTDSLLLVLALAGTLMAMGLASIDSLFTLLGAGEEHLPYLNDYMFWWYLGLPFIMIAMMGNSAMRAAGDAKLPAYVMLLFTLVNLALDPILIFGYLGAPALGVKGAAIATFISYFLAACTVFYFLQFRKKMMLYKLKIQEILQSWKHILHVGLPASTNNIINPISQALVLYMVAQFGSDAVAAYGVATRIEGFSIVVFMALAASMGPFVGQNYGAELYGRVYQGVFGCYRFCVIWGIAIAGLLWIFAPYFITWFTTDETISKIATSYLRIIPISFATLGMAMISSSYFNAKGTPLPAFAITVLRSFIILVPLAWLLQGWMGVNGIFCAIATANLVTGLGVFVFMSHLYRKDCYACA